MVQVPAWRVLAAPVSHQLLRTLLREDEEAAGRGGNQRDASATMIRADVKAEDHMTAKASPMRIARISMRGPFRFSSGRRLPQLSDRGKRIQCNADLRQTQRAARGRPFVRTDCDQSYSLTLSFSAFAMVILTTLSASFLNCSPVAGLRTIRSGRSRQ